MSKQDVNKKKKNTFKRMYEICPTINYQFGKTNKENN